MSGAEASTMMVAAATSLASPRRRIAGILWAALAVSIFSGWFVVTRFSVTRELRSWNITALRFGIGAVLLAPVLSRRCADLSGAAWREGLVFSILWRVPFVLLVALGLSLTSAAQAASIAPTLMPLFAGVFAWTFLGERQGRLRWGGYAAIFAGLSLLVLAGAAPHGPPSLVGLGAQAAAAAMWAVYTLLFRKSRLISGAHLLLIGRPVPLPASVLLDLSRLGQASTAELALQAAYQGVLMSGVAIFTFNCAVSLLGSAAATAIIAPLPAVASLLAIPALGEIPSGVVCAAIAIIVAGVLLAARRPATPEPL